jgi:hypothetical protein
VRVPCQKVAWKINPGKGTLSMLPAHLNELNLPSPGFTQLLLQKANLTERTVGVVYKGTFDSPPNPCVDINLSPNFGIVLSTDCAAEALMSLSGTIRPVGEGFHIKFRQNSGRPELVSSPPVYCYLERSEGVVHDRLDEESPFQDTKIGGFAVGQSGSLSIEIPNFVRDGWRLVLQLYVNTDPFIPGAVSILARDPIDDVGNWAWFWDF